MLTGADYLELLPATWRTINDYGIRIDGRTYDSAALNPLRRQHSGITAQRGRWEVRFDPYDLSQVWVRNHHHGGWLHAEWTHLPMVTAPFADFTWRHARRLATDAEGRAPDETGIARALAQLLTRAGEGPDTQTPRDRHVAARTRAAATTRPHIEPLALVTTTDDFLDEASADDESDVACEDLDSDDVDSEGLDCDDQEATVIPFGVFDAHAEAQRWP